MKDQPEIAPELRGLLEEIVADPRSSMRLVPRRALRRWFESGEVLRVGDVEGTNAERHLIAAHREELAELLRKASEIAYWKAPVLTHRPIGADGKPYDPAEAEPEWRRRVEKEVHLSGDAGEAVALLSRWVHNLDSDQAGALARASLGLVPNDRARFDVALVIPWSLPRTAIALLTRFGAVARSERSRSDMLISLAARLCSVGRYHEARDAYRASAGPSVSALGLAYALNLSCFLGEQDAALADAKRLSDAVGADISGVLEVRRVLEGWIGQRNDAELHNGARIAHRISDDVGKAARILCEVYES